MVPLKLTHTTNLLLSCVYLPGEQNEKRLDVIRQPTSILVLFFNLISRTIFFVFNRDFATQFQRKVWYQVVYIITNISLNIVIKTNVYNLNRPLPSRPSTLDHSFPSHLQHGFASPCLTCCIYLLTYLHISSFSQWRKQRLNSKRPTLKTIDFFFFMSRRAVTTRRARPSCPSTPRRTLCAPATLSMTRCTRATSARYCTLPQTIMRHPTY